MSIDTLKISNFKGISELTTFDIKPITLFIGPNSSGKSSCIHALAALAQTIKLGNSGRAIVLDDEYAQVHLGRFIEVIHSKNYSDSMDIGVGLINAQSPVRTKKGSVISSNPCEVLYSFKSTKRTQDVFIDNVSYKYGENDALTYKFSPKAQHYSIKKNGKTLQDFAINSSNLRFQLIPKKQNPNELRDDFFDMFVEAESLNELFNRAIRKIHYLGPFRQSPLRRYPTRGSNPDEVGAQGEGAITLLANEYVQSKNRKHIKEISGWLMDLGLAKGIEVSRVGKSDLFDVNVTLKDGASLPIADLGYGVSQALPVLVQCSFATQNSTLLFEQPELHLHPAAAEKLATIFSNVAKKKNLRIIAETHSRELFMQILRDLKSGTIALDDVAAYIVERKDGKSCYKKADIVEDNGYFEVNDPWDKNLLRI